MGSLIQLFQRPGSSSRRLGKMDYMMYVTRGVVECKMELMYVKLEATYYSMCSARQIIILYKQKISLFQQLGWLALACLIFFKIRTEP